MKDSNRNQIAGALAAMPADDFMAAAQELLNVLRYESTKRIPLSGDVDAFLAALPPSPKTQATERFRSNAASAHIVFQLTDEEIAVGAKGQQRLLTTNGFDTGNNKSFLFVAVELTGTSYSRSEYSLFTREINKRFPIPTVVLFKTANDLLTLAFVHRRENKRNPERDVLGSVALVRQIDLSDPHRAHLDILGDLALEERLRWMDTKDHPTNFDGLLAAWLDALDTEELNRRFYRDLFGWFERTIREATFPSKQKRTLPPEEHVIRLITRLLFIWFIKEKRLVAEELFIEEQVSRLLKNYDRDAGDSYYRAVLQNLFFATLNTEIGKRGFSKVSNTTHRNFSRYRHKKEISDPDALLDLLAQTPFINGGLFDCLDSEEATGDGGYRIDCFSDNPSHRNLLSIPNRLFFDDKGLIRLFEHYKFTVEENTPAEREVALDPELLGKVFENLLAAVNPETRETARKQTGSYYTPRPVVDYMVDEALVETLAAKIQPADGDSKFWRERLHYLLDYNDASELFDADETEGLVRAIAGIKILDPAVGSGAFPMGVLHKLTLALRRLDPENKQWETLQKEMAGRRATDAFDTHNRRERPAELKEISDTFERYRDSDFGRKLYLIQNSIFGVDIQPIACQIAKLRFFISLAIEQEPNSDQDDNFGIQPLPNLETRFVAANTLLGLGKRVLASDEAHRLERELHANRERHFHATNRRVKLRCRKVDEKLREALAGKLRQIGMPTAAADKIAQWNPYDQNAKADWFDAEYMFGVPKGFDAVIGNPPYIQLQKDGGKLGKLYKDIGYETFARTGDIYQLFYECGCQLLRPTQGLLVYITSNSWLKAEYGKALRRYFSERHTSLRLLETGKDVFENAIVDTSILIVREGRGNTTCDAVDMDKLDAKDFPPDESLWGQMHPDGEKPWSILSQAEHSVMNKMKAKGIPLKDWEIKINRGITTGCNDAFIIDDETKKGLVREDSNSADLIKPVLRGRDIQRYQAKWAGFWLINIPWHFPLHLDSAIKRSSSQAEDLFKEQYPVIYQYLLSHKSALSSRNRSETGIRYEWYALQRWGANYYEDFAKEKLLWIELVENGRFAYDDSGIYGEATSFIMTGESIKYLCAVLNGNLVRWFLQQIAPTSGTGTLRWKKVYVEVVPIPKISAADQRPFIRLVDYIIYLKQQSCTDGKNLSHSRDYLMVKYFEQIIDGLVYELYLTDELHSAGKYFSKPLLDEKLPSIEDVTDSKMSSIRGIFERLFDKNHPVRKNLFFLDSLETIRIIEGKT